MRFLVKGAKTILVVLIAIGVIRAVINYNNATDGHGIARLASAIVNAAEDITYRWIGPVLDFFASFVESIA